MFVRIFRNEKTNMNNIYVEWRTQINSIFAKIKNKSSINIIIFENLKIFVNLTNENKTYELFDYKSNDYVIDLKSNKIFFYNFIYSLSKNEFKILRIYLNKHFKNDFIKFFIFQSKYQFCSLKKTKFWNWM